MSVREANAVVLCSDDRLLRGRGTGVSTYARALHAAQARLADRALLLSGGKEGGPDGIPTRADRVRRQLRAIVPVGTRARADAGVGEWGGFLRHDLFRLGQAFFTLHGRPMPVHVPGPPGIMHWCYPLPLCVAGWRNVYTVHDAIPLAHPELSPIDSGRHARLLRAIATRADKLVTVSGAAAREIAARLDLPEERLVDCSQPVDVSAHLASPEPLPAGLVPGGYLLVCGTVEPRKNVARIAQAYRESGTALPLVVAGPDGWQAGPIADALRNTPGVIRVPWQSRATMLALLAEARALVMPSLAEGFGLPVAEAMALGTPVITSVFGALTETAGGAALLVDPLDTRAIAVAIGAVATDDALAHTLTAAGRDRSTAFSAAAFTGRLGALYARLAPD